MGTTPSVKIDGVQMTVVYKEMFEVKTAANATNSGSNGGVYSMTVDKTFAAEGETVTITVKSEKATAGTGATVTLGGATTTPRTLDFTDSDTTKTATFAMGTADVTLTMSAADKVGSLT